MPRHAAAPSWSSGSADRSVGAATDVAIRVIKSRTAAGDNACLACWLRFWGWNTYIRFMQLTGRSDEALGELAREVRYEQLRRRGKTHQCMVCGKDFIARTGAQLCSSTCRVRAHRLRTRTIRKANDVIGIGYQGLGVAALIERLRNEGVEVVVDVRLNAISRKAGYSKRALAAALQTAGIRYMHDRRLGNPRDNRAGYADVNSPEGTAAREHFRSLLTTESGAQAIDDLVELVNERPVAVLCFETDEAHCHREQIIDAVHEARHSLVAV